MVSVTAPTKQQGDNQTQPLLQEPKTQKQFTVMPNSDNCCLRPVSGSCAIPVRPMTKCEVQLNCLTVNWNRPGSHEEVFSRGTGHVFPEGKKGCLKLCIGLHRAGCSPKGDTFTSVNVFTFTKVSKGSEIGFKRCWLLYQGTAAPKPI